MKAHWRSLATLSLCMAAGLGGCSYDYKVNLFAIPDDTTKIEVLEWLRTTTRNDKTTETIQQSPNIFTYDASNTDISLFKKNDSFSFLVNSTIPTESTDKRFILELSVATFNSSSNITSYGSISNQLNGTSSSIESLDLFLPPTGSIVDKSGKTSGPVIFNASINKSLDQNANCNVLININGWRFHSEATISIDTTIQVQNMIFTATTRLDNNFIIRRTATNFQLSLPMSEMPMLSPSPQAKHYLVITNPGGSSTDPKTKNSAALQIAGSGIIVPLSLSCAL